MFVTDLRPLPARPNLEQYKKQAKDLVKDFRTAAYQTKARAARLLERVPERLTLSVAQLIIAREHGFASWPKFAAHVKALQIEDSPAAAFEAAAGAIARGEIELLQHLLRANPRIVFQRSARSHAAALLHYTAANGVEDFRQKTPPNIVAIADALLKAGAPVDAVAPIYGGSTALSLAASSVHPERAGVQIDLLQLLLEGGAAIDGVPGSANPILSALRNGRGRAAQFLAGRGARLDLESALGTGRIDALRETLQRGEYTLEQWKSGLAWACEYGHARAVEYVLERGSDPNELIFGQTPLHWAAMSAQHEIVRLLLDRNALPQIRNRYGATALGQARWSAEHDDDPTRFEPVIALLASAEAAS
ncbi:MAG TPA: ankyrin repeat domain-containing protein [Candidatus Baltobacteraceae bacterium]|nr:ankyrin repeat domain-containing protein [Candidatus Baltobacteraceae bacterium]